MDSLKNAALLNPDMGLGDQLMNDVQRQLDERRKMGDAAKNPLSMGDLTQSALGMASSMLGFANPAGPGGPLAKTLGLV